MDERLEKALEFSKYSATLQTQKDNLKLRLENMLLVKIDQNIFQVTKEDINFLQLCAEKQIKKTVLLDCHGNPVEINDIHKVIELFFTAYQEAYSEYCEKYNQLKKARSVEKVTS